LEICSCEKLTIAIKPPLYSSLFMPCECTETGYGAEEAFEKTNGEQRTLVLPLEHCKNKDRIKKRKCF
jgi:hypothetical protein